MVEQQPTPSSAEPNAVESVVFASSVPQQPPAVSPVVIEGDVHAFFYLWYGVPEVDGKYLHWNHEILQHWNPTIAKVRARAAISFFCTLLIELFASHSKNYPSGRYEPPNDFGATYAPARGLYSSGDRAVLEAQFAELRNVAGVHVISVSWWGPPFRNQSCDGQGVTTDRLIPLVLDVAQQQHLRVSFHLEPYPGHSL